MSVWLTSDMHLNHFNIIRYCNRPFTTADEMNNTIINNWNNTVKDGDTVINLGDVGFSLHKEENVELRNKIKYLKGKEKILIKGNHDKRAKEEYEAMGFRYEGAPIIYDFTTSDKKLCRILLSHTPQDVRGYRSMVQYNIHGHFHNNTHDHWEPNLVKMITDKHKIFILEKSYTPVLLEDFLKDDSNLTIHLIKGKHDNTHTTV